MAESKLATLYVDVTMKDGKLVGQLNNTKNKLEKAEKGFGSIAAKAAAAAGVMTAFGLAMANVAEATANAEESESKFRAVFKEFADEGMELVESLAGSTKRSKYELTAYMATIQDTLVPMGMARGEAAKLSGTITKLGVDLSSFNNMPTEEVIRGIQSALVGNHETMRRYGVVINDNKLKQELMNMGFYRGTKHASEQMKIQARLNIIMRETSDAQGDAKRTADSLANTIVGLNSAWEEMLVNVGKAFGDDMKDGVNGMITVLDGLSVSIQAVVGVFKEVRDFVSWATGAGFAIDTIMSWAGPGDNSKSEFDERYQKYLERQARASEQTAKNTEAGKQAIMVTP